MEDEVELASELLHRSVNQLLEVFDGGGVGGDDLGPAFFCELVDGAEPDGYRGVCEYQFRSFLGSPLGCFPGYRLVVEGTEYDAFLSFQ